jgi:hypothetical protein
MKGKFLTLVGTALTLALTSNVAVAQSTKFLIAQQSQPSSGSSSSAPEIKLSPQGMEILCKYYPLNSRCANNAGATQQSPSGRSTETQKKPADSGSANPGTTRAEPRPSVTDPNAPGVVPDPSVPGNVKQPGALTDPSAPNTLTEPGAMPINPSTPGSTRIEPGPATTDPSAPGILPGPGSSTIDPSAPGGNYPNQVPSGSGVTPGTAR